MIIKGNAKLVLETRVKLAVFKKLIEKYTGDIVTSFDDKPFIQTQIVEITIDRITDKQNL